MKSFRKVSRRTVARLNRRQRKKLRVGEFQELAFSFDVTFASALDEAQWHLLWSDFIDCVESLGLQVAGFGGAFPLTETGAFVVRFGRGSVSPEQRDALLAWLRNRPEVASAHASDFVDAWHGWEDA
jgi:uncharacterized protein YggL (DUF469 family)